MNQERGKFIGNSIFADGGSAAIVGPGGPGDWVLTGGGTHILGKDTRAAMTWFPSDHCYEMYLDKSIGNSLGWYIFKNLGPMLSEACHTTDKSSVHWAIHPGGKAILEGLEKVGVSKADLQQSRTSWSSTETCLLPLSSSFFKHRWLTRPCRRTDCSHLRLGPGLQLRLLASQSCWTHRPCRMPHRIPHPERLLPCPVVSCCPRLLPRLPPPCHDSSVQAQVKA